jgi:predicted SnoaL-like aldol condensation-catalyzing enzyme
MYERLIDQAHHSPEQRAMAKLVMNFYGKVFNQRDFHAGRLLIADNYRQHDPQAEDGPEGLRRFLEKMTQENPGFRIEFKRLFVDNDHVVVHCVVVRYPGDQGLAVLDLFRVENGKIAEHWDVIQEIPAVSANSNSMC